MNNKVPTTDSLLALAVAGDGAAWGALLTGYEDKLLRMIEFRMDPRLRGRIDAQDVLQDAFVAASATRHVYFRAPSAPLFAWLRGVVINKLLELHRHHLGTRMRNAKRECSLKGMGNEGDTTSSICVYLTGHLTSPSSAAVRNEVHLRLYAALESMSATDREVLALRHFEQLSNLEAAQVLGIQERAAAKRYLRALERLKETLEQMSGGLSELRL